MRVVHGFLAFACLALACAGSQPLVTPSGVDLTTAPVVYTLVNLHPDDERARLYAVNYQQPGLIPVCSEVKILGLKSNQMRFQVVKSGKEYSYINHKEAAGEPFNAHLLRFFGPECDRKGIDRLNAADKAGVKAGTVSAGMTKQGVIFAVGYPPKNRTPDLTSNEWTYWKSRFDTFLVTFDDKGKVDGVKN
jgi:hypothetical protein